MQLLLLSNSTNHGESYMQWCKHTIANFVENHNQHIVFISYAAASFPLEEYTTKVNEALQEVKISVNGIESFENLKEAVANATAIFVGGGNTFYLLRMLQDNDLVEVIRNKVANGTPYVGWSAGSNIASPTICTTNDMPIVEPRSFEALNLVPFQINPHYTENTIPNHGGESRKQRLEEYLYMNRNESVVCLPEATYLVKSGDAVKYKGQHQAKILRFQVEEIVQDDFEVRVS